MLPAQLKHRRQLVPVLTILHGLGANITLCNPDNPKAVIPSNWDFLDTRATLQEVLAHAKAGGRFGLVPWWGTWRFVVTDVDRGDPDNMINAFSPLCHYPTTTPGHAHLWHVGTQPVTAKSWSARDCGGQIISDRSHVALPNPVEFYRVFTEGLASAHGVAPPPKQTQIRRRSELGNVPFSSFLAQLRIMGDSGTHLVLNLKSHLFPLHLIPYTRNTTPAAPSGLRNIYVIAGPEEFPDGSHLRYGNRDQGMFDLGRQWLYRNAPHDDYLATHELALRCFKAIHATIPHSPDAVANAKSPEDRAGFLSENRPTGQATRVAAFIYTKFGIAQGGSHNIFASIEAVAAKTGEDISQVASRFAKHAHQNRRRSSAPNDLKMSAHVSQGHSISATARTFACHRATVYRALRRVADYAVQPTLLPPLELQKTAAKPAPAPNISSEQTPPDVRLGGFPQTPFLNSPSVPIKPNFQNTRANSSTILHTPDLLPRHASAQTGSNEEPDQLEDRDRGPP